MTLALMSCIDGKKHRFDTAARPGARVIEGAFDGAPFAVKIKTAPDGYTLKLARRLGAGASGDAARR